LGTATELERHFGIPEIAQVLEGNGGLPKVRIISSAGAGEVYLDGAHVTSWQPAGSEEVVFVSSKSRWEDGRAIRGGFSFASLGLVTKPTTLKLRHMDLFARRLGNSIRLHNLEIRSRSACRPPVTTARNNGGQLTFD